MESVIRLHHYLLRLARNDDEKRLISRLDELVERTARERAGYSDFLDLRQQDLARAVAVNAYDISWQLVGGYEEAERKRLVVYPEWQTEADTNIAFVRIESKQFGEPSLGHRDYLGAVLNLGLKREKLGDIIVQDDGAILIADQGLADFICQQLIKVKHITVTAKEISGLEFFYSAPQLKAAKFTVASLRLDAVVAGAFKLSRADVDEYVEGGNIKINHLEVLKGSVPVSAGDLISVRGLGRFRLNQVGGTSRKGRHFVSISLF
jgi:RNA-binding protein YlmH